MLILFRWQHPGSLRQSGVLGTFFSLTHALPWKPATRPPKSRFGSLPPPATQGHHPKRDGRTYLVFAVAHHHHHMGNATTGMDLCCYVGVKYHKVRCLFLSSLEWKCSTGLVRASPVDPSCRDVGIASVQRSSRPESWAPALPGSVWKVTGDRCFTLAVAGVHAGKTEQCFIFIKNDMSLHW